MELVRLSYVSVAAPGVDDTEVRRIIETAQRVNARLGITGAMLSYAGRFLQVLEGPAATVDETFGRIAADARHAQVVLIERERASTRLFNRWSMLHVPAPRGHDPAVNGFLSELSLAPDAKHAHTALALLERLASSAAT